MNVIPDGTDTPLNTSAIGSACSISSEGKIEGSLTVPSDIAPGPLQVQVCGARCRDSDGQPGWSASTPLLVEAIVPEVSISVGPNPARAGDKVTVAGSLSEPVEATTCAVSLDDVPVDSTLFHRCGSSSPDPSPFPRRSEAGAAEVVVCEPECQGPVIHWRASTSLTIELASVEPTPDPSTPVRPTPVASHTDRFHPCSTRYPHLQRKQFRYRTWPNWIFRMPKRPCRKPACVSRSAVTKAGG